MRSSVVVLVLLLVALQCGVALARGRTKWHQLTEDYGFEDYAKEFHKVYHSEEERSLRRALVESRLTRIRKHNSDPNATYKMGVNAFTDWTEEERQGRRGYKKAWGFASRSSDATALPSPPSIEERSILDNLPESVDWRDMDIISTIKNQGNCGSCWSFAAAESIESYWALATGYLGVYSEQNILSCTPNPYQCGGDGGCGGATCELAFQQIISQGGIPSEWTYPYLSYQGKDFQCGFNSTSMPPIAVLESYVKLPTNQYTPIMEHVARKGPLAVTVDASDWYEYEYGVFNGCDQVNPDLDHAVQLVGYGVDDSFGPYYLVRNSWGDWGEDGYIRLARSDDQNTLCGNDTTPLDGTACVGGPSSVTVCGTCGILYDTSFPVVNA